MKVEDIRNYPIKLPYIIPLKTSTNYFDVTTGLLVEILTNEGLKGYGYSELFPRTGETITTAQAMMKEILVPGIKGKDPREVRNILEWMDHKIVGNQRVKAGLETALQDLRGKANGVPVYELLGGAVRKSV